jgi:hypothetical protein
MHSNDNLRDFIQPLRSCVASDSDRAAARISGDGISQSLLRVLMEWSADNGTNGNVIA